MMTAGLEDVTYRGEMAKRYVQASSFLCRAFTPLPSTMAMK